jgi:molybdenum cofactor cytidylyltransferase
MLAAVVLSAGKSERMGGSPKALLQFKGRTFLEHVVDSISKAGIEHTVVVVGHHRAEIEAAFSAAPLVFNPNYEQGMSTSVQAGIRALPAGVEAAGIFLVDQPLIHPDTILAVTSQVRPGGIVLPVCEGRRGHPVFFAADLFGEILKLGPDQGLNTVVRRDPTRIVEVSVKNSGILHDIDTPEELANLLREQE